jgi:hypothetical protein
MSNVLDFGVSGAFGSKVGGLGTAVKYFPRPLGPSIGVAPSTPSSTSAVGSLFLPAQNTFNGQTFNIYASGSFGSDSGDPSGTVTVQLYAVTGSLASPTYTSIATTAAITPFYAIEPWGIEVELLGASVNGANGLLLASYSNIKRANTTQSLTAQTTIVTGLDFNAGNPALQQGAVCGFVVGVTFGTSDATNTATLNEFTVES